MIGNIQLSDYEKNSGIIRQTILQIEKDFSEFGISINDKEVSSIKKLVDVMVETILELLELNQSKLYNLLYRIDVSESRIQSIINQEKGKTIEWILAYLIVEREFQKVVIRNHYSNHLEEM